MISPSSLEEAKQRDEEGEVDFFLAKGMSMNRVSELAKLKLKKLFFPL